MYRFVSKTRPPRQYLIKLAVAANVMGGQTLSLLILMLEQKDVIQRLHYLQLLILRTNILKAFFKL